MRKPKQRYRTTLILATAITLVGIACLITGVVLLVKRNNSVNCETTEGSEKEKSPDKKVERCAFSVEAKRCGLDVFLQKVFDTTYELHPFLISTKPKVSVEEVKMKYKAYDPSPSNLKHVTDTAKSLLEELTRKEINEKKLNLRERKALAQLRHFLKHIFGTPYDGNYYFGDFLLGPNVFCWQHICSVGSSLQQSLGFFKPGDASGLEVLIEKLAEVDKTFKTYTDNLKYGVKAGMVRSEEECVAGLDAIKRHFLSISVDGPEGVFNESFMQHILRPDFLVMLEHNTEEMDKWKTKHQGKTPSQSLRESILDHVGRPIYTFLRYLEADHIQYCVPSSVSSGLSSLPVSYVYVNGSANISQPTTKVLPFGEPLNGSKAYMELLSFFTTTKSTPDEVYNLGYDMLRKLYPEALEVAHELTGPNNTNITAKDEFMKLLNDSNMFFNEKSFPQNESDKNAFKLCSSAEKAEKFCPKRWRAIQEWFKEAREVMSMLDPKTSQMFYFTGEKNTAPNCPVELMPNFNPSAGVPSYLGSDKACSRNAIYKIPFFLEWLGPRYMQWSVNAHEARPGHHTQVQGLTEHFQDTCRGVIGWLSSVTSYTAFIEGWALYAENPLIAYDTDTYKDEPLYKYGMLKSQLWRALRLIVDTGLHYKGMTREDSLRLFQKYLWDNSDVAIKEVTRYQSVPGQATSYMIGQLHIMKLREYAKKKLGKEFNLKDFHFQVLFQGSAPLSFLQQSIEQYVDCTLNKNKEGCDEVLDPLFKDSQDNVSKNDEIDTIDSTQRELYF